jgi:hypothetical protein
MLQHGEHSLAALVSYLDHNAPACGFTWSMGYAELLCQTLYPAMMSLCWNEYHEPDKRFARETDHWHFHRKQPLSRLHNLLCAYTSRCRRSRTRLANKLHYCRCLSDCFTERYYKPEGRCRNPRFCPFCLFLDRAAPLYLSNVRLFGKSPESSFLRLYHLRFRSNQRANSFEGIQRAVAQLTYLRNRIKNSGIIRDSVRHWSGISLLGRNSSQLRASLDVLCVADRASLARFDKLSGQFPDHRCTLFYCVYGTKMNLQRRIGSFLQYPVWYLTSPFTELEDYLQTDFFRTRLSRLT